MPQSRRVDPVARPAEPTFGDRRLWVFIPLAITLALFAAVVQTQSFAPPSIAADQTYYTAGDKVFISGVDWPAGAQVAFQVVEDGNPGHVDTLHATADAGGGVTVDYVVPGHGNVQNFTVIATSQSVESPVTTGFTDEGTAVLSWNATSWTTALPATTPWVRTDLDDYQPGEVALIAGGGWTPGDLVTLDFTETGPEYFHPPARLHAVADETGSIYAGYVLQPHDLGQSYSLAATSVADPQVKAQTTFTDDLTPQTLPFAQDWTNIGLITVDDTWSGVPGIVGHRGDGLTSATAVDPQTVLADGAVTPSDVTANQTNPNTFATGGVAEFHLTNPVVALQGSGTARAPHLVITLSTSGLDNVNVAYNLRDVDGSADNAVQPVALQYRVGASGAYTNVPAAFVADATTGPSVATLVTPVSVPLPAAAGNQPLVQLRIITTDAVGSDEWVGVDDISVTGSAVDQAPTVQATTPADTATGVVVGTNVSITFSESVNVTGSWFSIVCGASGTHSATVSGGPSTFTLDPTLDFASGESCDVTIDASSITDQDNAPPDTMADDYTFTFTTAASVVRPTLVINEIDYDQPSTDTAEFLEIQNVGATAVSLDGVSVVYVNGNGGGAATYRTTALPSVNLAAGDYFVVCANGTNTPNCDLDEATDTDLIQNGAPDALALVFAGTIIDTVSYEGNTGAPYTEDSGVGLVDTGTAAVSESISRCLDGTDTNRNSADFLLRAATPGSSNACPGVDLAPTVSSTTPTHLAAGVPLDSGIAITFSEPVNVTGAWFSISCATSGVHTASVAGGPTTFALDPAVNFTPNELCTVTVAGASVADQDLSDPPDAMAANHVFSFQTADVLVCGGAATRIHAVQGSGLASPIVGTIVTIEGVVVGDYQVGGLGGYFLQEEATDVDLDPETSEGVFVFANGFGPDVSSGDIVRVRGTVTEFKRTADEVSGLTEVSGITGVQVCSTGATVAPTAISLPVASLSDLEAFEGMSVTFPQALVIAEYFDYERFGELVLALPLPGETRPFTGTSIEEPGAAALARAEANSLRRITLDDGLTTQNPATLRHPNGAPFALDNRFRGGDTVTNAAGVLGYDFGLYRIQPTGPASYTSVNPRPSSPEPVGGTVRVAAMNTLNFFVTLDTTANDSGPGPCGGNANLDCRGADADQPLEFTRQRDKLLTALSGLDADIIGLNELENTPGVEPLLSIVTGMPGYAYIDTGTIGTDAIKVGLIYRSAVVSPVGSFQTLDSAVDPRFIDTKSRPSLAQTFMVNATGAKFTVAVNHLKSKGSGCNDVNDPDLGDGQGNCSQTRRAAAEALVDWLATDPTDSGDPDFLIVGDLNSYAQEDTIDEIKEGSDDTASTSDDFTNLISYFHGAFAYSYTFDGAAGYLDHALANASLLAQVTGAADWHINSDEPDIFDYDTTFKPAAQEALYEVNPYRTSDHDAVVIGLTLSAPAPPTVGAGGPYSAPEGGSATLTATGSDPDGDSLTYAWDLDNNGSFETSGQSVTFDASLRDGPSSFTVNVRVTDPGGLSAQSSATVNVTNVPPTVGAAFGVGIVSVSCGLNNATLTVTFSDSAAADTHSAVINWGDGNTQTVGAATSPLVLSHSYAAAGQYTATVSVSDDDGGTSTATAAVAVKLNTSGFLQPINADGTSVFKYKSTVPVKIAFTNCDGSGPANLAPTIALTMISGATPGLEINEPLSTSAADTTGVMRFSSGQYIYNLATRSLPDSSATYRITVTVPSTGQTHTVQFGLRP